MSRLQGIPPKLHEIVLEKTAEGWGAGKISNLLLKEHETKVSIKCVTNLIKRITEERKETAKAAYAKSVSESANQDVSILGDKINKLDIILDEVLIEKDALKIDKIGNILLKFIDRRMKMSGIDKEDNGDDNLILQSLLDKLGK